MKQIWVDADACPKVIKETLFRAATRVQFPLILVANQPLQHPRSPHIRAVQVAAGFDVADNYIVQEMEPGDLVITADIPLAAEVIEKGEERSIPVGNYIMIKTFNNASPCVILWRKCVMPVLRQEARHLSVRKSAVTLPMS